MKWSRVPAGALALAGVVTLLTGVSVASAGDAPDSTLDSTPDSSAEERLADKYAPIVMIKSQDKPCDPDGEQYAPTSVDIVVDNPDVLLRQVGNDDPVIMRAPGAADLFGLSEGFYLDFPGSAFEPACVYETDFDRYSGTQTGERQAVVYAHVARQDDRPDELALQYWFYWYFNDWNNKHEGDWEGIQLLFEASSVEDALTQQPVSVGYAQHEGGERADWDSDKLKRDGDRPVVYPSAGSHASYYGSALYLGRSGSEGFGCDTTDGPSDRIAADVVLLPSSVEDPDDPLAWLAFEGRWGERQSGAFNGPTGPLDKERWDNPIDWHDELRANAVVVPAGDSQGDVIVNTFCNVVEWGSGSLILFRTSPLQLLVAFTLAFLLARWLVRRTVWDRVPGAPLVRRRRAGQIIRAAASSYRHRARALIVFGLVYMPTAVIVGGAIAVIERLPLVRQLIDLVGEAGEINLGSAMVAGGIASLISYVAVNAMVAAYYGQYGRGDDGTPLDAVRYAWKRAPALAAGFGRAFAIVLVLMLSIVGIPWGIRQLVRYQFMPQAVVLEDLNGREGLARSTALVQGRWWHTAVMVTLFHLLIAFSGMVIGLLLLLIVAGIPLWLFSGLVTLVYALIVPLAAVAQTLLYGDAVAEKANETKGVRPLSSHL